MASLGSEITKLVLATKRIIFGTDLTVGNSAVLVSGTGVPAAAEKNGSLYLRDDPADAATVVYIRSGGAWSAIDGTIPAARNLTAGTGMTGGGDLSADRTFNVVANADASIIANANDIQVGVLATDAQHGNRGGGGIHAVATVSTAGFMSAAQATIVAASTGAVRAIRYTIATSATTDSTAVLPAGVRVIDCWVEITTAYSAGATISVGQVGSTSAFQATTDNNPQGIAGDIYALPQDTAVSGSGLVVRTTIGGAPGAGAGVVVVRYTAADA